MATTVGTVGPIIPSSIGGGGSKQTAAMGSFTLKADEVVRVGDVLVLASGVADRVDTAQTDGTILGVCMQAKTGIATTANFSDQVLIAMALPGTTFQGSMIISAGTNYTANATADIVGTTTDTVLNTDAYAPFICIAQGDTTGGQIRLISFAHEQRNGQNFTTAGTTIVNPRVNFTFRTTVFQPLA